jgi:hypothetical protein
VFIRKTAKEAFPERHKTLIGPYNNPSGLFGRGDFLQAPSQIFQKEKIGPPGRGDLSLE